MPPKKRQRQAEPGDDSHNSEGLEPRTALRQIDDVVQDLLTQLPQDRSSSSTSHDNNLDVHKIQQGLLTLKTIQNALWKDLETTQKALEERKARRTKVQQQLQGLAYEADCLQAEIKTCRAYETPYLQRLAADEQAASVTDFLQADATDSAHRQVIVNKLQTEINARGTLQRDLQTKQTTLVALQDTLKRKKAFLQSLPHHAATMERASSALQKTMFSSTETTRELRWNGTERRARLKLAQHLSLPLFTLYSSLQNYIDCVGAVIPQDDNDGKEGDHPPSTTPKRMTLTVHAKATGDSHSSSHQSVNWTIPIPDPVVPTGRPKKITLQFQYPDNGGSVVTAVIAGGANTLWAPTKVLQDLFPSEETKDDATVVAAAATPRREDTTTATSTATKSLSWCNYLAGLHLPEPHVHAASVRSIVRVLCRRLRANAILKIMLTALSRNQVPNPPADAKLEDATIELDHKCQLVSCTALTASQSSSMVMNVYRMTLRQASRRLTVHVDVHPTRYPEIPPKWSLNSNPDVTDQPPVYDERLAAMEHKVNVELLQSMEKAPEVAQEWLLVHQLHVLMTAWDEE